MGLLGVVLLTACAARPPVLPGNLVAASTPLVALEIFPDRAQDKHYDAVGTGGSFILRTLTPTQGPAGDTGLDVRSLTFAAGVDPATATPLESRFLTLARAADGSILLVSSREGDRTTLFEPPLVFMPASLSAGEAFSSTTDARVVNAEGRQQASGHATRRVTYSGDQMDGAGQARRIVAASLELVVFPARVVTHTTYWINARGILREQQTTNVAVLGLPFESRHHDVMLREDPEAGAGAAAARVGEFGP